MPEKQITTSREFNLISSYIDRNNGQPINTDHPGEFMVNGEPMILRGRFNYLIPWVNMLHLNFRPEFRMVRGYVGCSENHERDLKQLGINFPVEAQQGAQTP